MDRYAVLRGRTDKLLDKYGSLLAELSSAPPQQERLASSQSPKDAHAATNTTSLKRFMDSYHRVKRCHESQVLSVGLLALTKSGKSTFLNALLGEECMPSGTVPETARICRIIHDPKQREPVMVDDKVTLKGSVAVRQRLHNLNSAVRERTRGDGEEEILSITTSFPALEKLQSMPTTLHLLDTPGPNEAGEEGLKYQVERLLDGIGVLVYLLDCSKLKTQEEKQMFRRLKEINPQLLKRLSDRLFFLVNKKDVLDDMSEEEVRRYVSELVTGQMEDQEFQLKPQQVMLISAKTALYSRLVMTRKASQEQRKVFAKMAFGQAGYKEATEAGMLQAAKVMFEESGFQAVEQRLLHFLYDHAGRLQLMGTMDDMTRNATQVLNTVAASEAAMQRGVKEMSLKMAEMSAQMKHASQRFEDVRLHTDGVQREVTDEIRNRLMKLKKHLLHQIEAVMSGKECQNLSTSWERLRDYVQNALHSARCVPIQSPRAEVEIQNRLADVYASINDQVGHEVRSFWHDLENATTQRQQKLFAVLNKKLQNLSREFESVVSKRLDLQLETAKVRISPPSFQEYHLSLGKLLAQQVEGARQALDAYCASYHAVMGAALAESRKSEGARLAALARARQRLQAFRQLKAEMEGLAVDAAEGGARRERRRGGVAAAATGKTETERSGRRRRQLCDNSNICSDNISPLITGEDRRLLLALLT